MRMILGACVALALASSGVLADGADLAGSLWMCSRAKDGSQFVITFYPGGGVGGGEFQDDEVSPYVFDASGMRDDQWPGRWRQKGRRFTWNFPDQRMRIAGRIDAPGQRGERLVGTEAAAGAGSAIACERRSEVPKIGEGLVIPKDRRFMDLDNGEGTLKVPVGISLQEPGRAR
jgi:hypothetical protein